MPAARYWRAVGFEAHAGGDLEMSALHVYDDTGRVDAGATLTCTFTPVSGSLANLQDEDFGTTVRFAAASVYAPSFALAWDFGTEVDAWGVRTSGPDKERSLKSLTWQYSSDGVAWADKSATLGDFVYAGASTLTPAPVGPPWGGVWVQQTAIGDTTYPSTAASADGMILLAAPGSGYLQVSNDGGETWAQKTAAGSRSWYAVAMSADGSRIYGFSSTGVVLISADAGATWTAVTAASGAFEKVASSSNGMVLLASLSSTSANLQVSIDGGVTWVQRAGLRDWTYVAMSADGSRMFAGANLNYVHTSSDSGANWTQRTGAGSGYWRGIAVSDSGMKVLATMSSGRPSVSSDGGVNWSTPASGPNNSADIAVVSSDGETMALAATQGTFRFISVSRNGGATWVNGAGSGTNPWSGISMSSGGNLMLAAAAPGLLYVSTNGGENWTAQDSAGSTSWRSPVVSADGSRLIARSTANIFTYLAFKEPSFATPARRMVDTGKPIVFASSALPEVTAVKLQDAMPWRDMEFSGNGRIADTVKEKNTPVNTPLRRRVRLFRDIDGLMIRETWSDAATGAYSFQCIDERYTYSVVSYDHLGNYRAVIADHLTPELMA